MLISRNSWRRMAAGALSAGTVAGALLVGATGPAQAAPGDAATPPPAAVQMAGTRADLPVAFGNRVAIDRSPADTVFAATWHTAPMPQTTWAQHRHWWRHHHHFWHRWWWWW